MSILLLDDISNYIIVYEYAIIKSTRNQPKYRDFILNTMKIFCLLSRCEISHTCLVAVYIYKLRMHKDSSYRCSLINANNLLDLLIAVVFLQVYGSNNDRILLVSAICGPCEVLHVDKFREETKRRCQLDSSVCRLHPIFFCRSVSHPLIFSITVFSQQLYLFAKLVAQPLTPSVA